MGHTSFNLEFLWQVVQRIRMALTMQCELRNENLVTYRWVVSKKAKVGEKLTAKAFDEVTDQQWVIHKTYPSIEYDEVYHFHVIK